MKRSLLIAIGLLGVVAASCGGARPPEKHPDEVALSPDAPVPPPAVLPPLPDRHAKLTYKIGTLAPQPFVHGTLNGKPTWIVVDSGAGAQFASSWMADRAKVERRPSERSISDHVRHELSVTLADRSLVVIDDWGGMTPGDLLVIDESAHGLSGQYGIGVVMSPQALDEDRPVILELDRAAMRTGSEADAIAALAARKIPIDSTDIQFCHGIFSVPAIVAGHTARLIVDTGSPTTDLYSLSEAGRALAPKSVPSRSISESSSGRVETRTYKAAQVAMGGLSMRKDVDILVGAPEIECPIDGVIGVDVLRSCVLVFGTPKGRLRMQCDE